MNVYDFDETIFYPNALVKFNLFCIKRHPKLWFTYFPKALLATLSYKVFKTGLPRITLKLCGIVRYLKNTKEDVEAFWDEYEKNISSWYLKQKKSDDLIISGSPDFLIDPIVKRLGVNSICTNVDIETGVLIGNVRLAREKAKFIIDLDMPMIENFYSDSLGDTPIALLAENAFLVSEKAQKLEPWPHLTKELTKDIKKKINEDLKKRKK